MKPNLNNNLVLVVDDSPETLGMLNEALEQAGMTTLVALEGKQALNIAEKMQPDIILLDAIMPTLDGFETCIQLKANSKLSHIPVIFMTGLSDTESIIKGLDAGGVDYLTKPIKPLELLARIQVHLSNARTTLSAKSALDSTGRSLLSIDNNGTTSWSTPQSDLIMDKVKKNGDLSKLEHRLAQWLSREPKSGNKLLFDFDNLSMTAIYIGVSNDNEHLIKLTDNRDLDEKSALEKHFNITQREADVFLWLAKGKTNREIAQILEMSPRTVNKHLEQLFRKLDVDNRTSAAAKAIQHLQNHIGFY